MPSLYARFLRRQIKRINPVIRYMEVPHLRAAQDRLGKLSARVFASGARFSAVENHSADFMRWAAPADRNPRVTALYLHGGGYVAGSMDYTMMFAGILAARLGIKVLCVGYRLAPENQFPAALDDALAAYETALESDPNGVAVIGESAGGGLALALGHYLKEKRLKMPRCIVAISPWADLTLSGDSHSSNKGSDVALSYDILKASADMYAPGDKKNPLVSPVFGDFAGFPPCLLIASGDETLLNDAEMIRRKYDEAQGVCELHVEQGMWHVYPIYNTRESKEALSRIGSFVFEQFEGGGV